MSTQKNNLDIQKIRVTLKEVIRIFCGIILDRCTISEVFCFEEKRKLLEDYHEGILNAEEYSEKRSRVIVSLEKTQEELEMKKNSTERLDGWEKGEQNEIETLLKYSKMEILNKEIVEAFVEKIEVDGDRNIDIYWKFRI